MSWDIYVHDFPDVPTIKDLPDDFSSRPIGTREEVIRKFVEVCPAADFSDPSRGRVRGNGWSIEVGIGNEEPCTGFALMVHGGGDEVVELIGAILDHFKLRGAKSGGGGSDFFDVDESKASFEDWQAYRDRVIEDESQDSSERDE